MATIEDAKTQDDLLILSPKRRRPMSKNECIALEAASASITTASVTIKTLRVNSRQLTMGTFRQLPIRKLVDDDRVELCGTVWGWVNYNPADCEYKTQFVVQFGEELCRCPFWVRDIMSGDRWRRHPEQRWPYHLQAVGRRYDLARACSVFDSAVRGSLKIPEGPIVSELALVAMGHEPFADCNELSVGYQCEHDMKVRDLIYSCVNPKAVTRYDYSAGTGKPREAIVKPAEDVREESRAALLKYMRSLGCDSRAPDEWVRLIDALVTHGNDYICRWNALMERLRTVGQLYIAT